MAADHYLNRYEEIIAEASEAFDAELTALHAAGFDARVETTGGGCLAIEIDLHRPSVERENGTFTDHVLITDEYGPLIIPVDDDPYDEQAKWLVGLYCEANEWTAEDGTDFLITADARTTDALVAAVRKVLA